MATAEQLRRINAAGLKHRQEGGDYWMYEDRIEDTAYVLGREFGLSIADAPIVEGYRFGAVPSEGVSTNHAEDRRELGLSMAHIPAVDPGKVWGLWSYASGKERVHARGLLVPETGSDGEPLILLCD